VKLFVGAYLAVLGDAEAVIFSGGIGENTPEVRTNVCDGLGRWGLELDEDLNARTMSGDARVSTASSITAAWVIHSEEGLQLAHECAQIR
jgi:acetate kinase